MGAIGAFILLQVSLLAYTALDRRLILVQIVAHALVVRFTGLFTTPGLVGVDNWTHIVEYVGPVLETGSLAPMADVKYLYAPFHHLAVVAGTELLGVSPRVALYLVVGTAVVLSALFVYGTARYFVSTRWALFAVAAFAMADQTIRWGMHVIPTSLGLAFFLGILFMITRVIHRDTSAVDWVVLCGLIVAITLTHQLSAFVSLSVLGVAALAQVFVSRVGDPTGGTGGAIPNDQSPSPRANLLGVFGFHLAFTAAVWSQTPWVGDRFLTRAVDLFFVNLRRSAGFLNLVESTPAEGGAGGGAVGSSVIRLSGYLDALGFLILLLVTVVGALALVRRHRAPQASYTLVAGAVVMAVFALVLPLFGLRNFLPGRWFVFLYAAMAVIGAVGLWHLGDRFDSRAVPIVIALLLVAYPMAMGTAQKATLDDPTFEDQWPQYAVSESEIVAMDSVGSTVPEGDERIFTDHPYRSLFTVGAGFPADTINLTAVNRTSSPYDRHLYRTYQSTAAPQFVTRGDIVVTRQIPRERLCPATRNHVYDSQDTTLCTQPGL
jgi:hypothetical protein